MQVKMDYGHEGFLIDVPIHADVFTVREVLPQADEEKAIRYALQNPIQSRPLNALVRQGMKVLIVHSDITRATPNDRLIPVIISELENAGVNSKDITLLNGLGTHRPQTMDEMVTMLGANIVARYRCIQHDAYDNSQQVTIGKNSKGLPIRINRLLFESDFIILTGFIEPHFFAGYSGGPKAILPALASAENVFSNHGPKNICHPKATFNITNGNPIWEEMKAAAEQVENTFLVNVTLNRENKITAVFTGDIIAAHQLGCKFVREQSLFHISEPYDLVITSNSGYPLDQNLYQCVKGLAAANRAVRHGGAILLIAACEEGLPEHGKYAQLLTEADSPKAILEKVTQPGYLGQDGWQVQVQAQVQQHAHVYIYSDGLDDEQVKNSMLSPLRDLNNGIRHLIEQFGSRVCVLPQGPLTILEME